MSEPKKTLFSPAIFQCESESIQSLENPLSYPSPRFLKTYVCNNEKKNGHCIEHDKRMEDLRKQSKELESTNWRYNNY